MRYLDAEQRAQLEAYVDQLGPSLMESLSTVPREENPLQWDQVNSALKGHLRTALLGAIKATVDKLVTIPTLQGKLRGIDT